MNFNVIFANSTTIEPPNFVMNREKGAARYMFFHFVNPVEISLDGQTFITNPGAVILYEPNYPQIFRPYNERLNHDYVDFEVIDEQIFENIHFPLNTVIYPRMSKYITASVKEINNAKREENAGFAYEIDTKFTLLLLSISRSISTKKNHKDVESQERLQSDFEQMRLSLYTNPSHASVSSLAESMGFSSSYFNKKYKDLFHISPIDDINKARIEYVKTLLLQDQNIDTIVDALGFSNNEYFYRWFKKMTGVTPKEFVNSK